MSNLTINRIGPEAQADSAWHDEDIEAMRFAALDAPRRSLRGRDLLGAALAALAALAGWLGMMLVFTAAATYTEWASPSSPWLTFWQALLALTASTPLVLAAILAGVWAYDRWLQARRGAIVRDRLMNPVPATLIARMNWPEYGAMLERMAALERDVAPYRAYRGVESLSLSAGQSRPAAASEPLALPASVPVDPPAVWLDEVLATEAHLMLAGRSGSGKTATAEALLARAIDRGCRHGH